MRRGTWLTTKVRAWLEKAEAEHVARKCGGDQRCPWCCQWMNHFTTTHIRPYRDGMLDEIVCGNCYGTSFWKWELGFVFITAGEIPAKAEKAIEKPEGAFLAGIVADIRQTIAERVRLRQGAQSSEAPPLGLAERSSPETGADGEAGSPGISSETNPNG